MNTADPRRRPSAHPQGDSRLAPRDARSALPSRGRAPLTLGVAATGCLVVALTNCSDPSATPPPAPAAPEATPAADAVEAAVDLRHRFAPILGAAATAWERTGDHYRAADALTAAATPARANGPVELRTHRGDAAITFALPDAAPVAGIADRDIVFFRDALGPGAHLLHRRVAGGVEDLVAYDRAPSEPRLRYEIHLDEGHGLRLVDGTLEVVDRQGAPQLHVRRPWVADADGRHPATLAVRDCAVDTDPRAPWGHSPVAPGASSCTVEVSWGDDVRYPALVDPEWLDTSVPLAAERLVPTVTPLSPGDVGTVVLVAGGFDQGGNALASAELFHPLHRTFAATGPLGSARGAHRAVALADIPATGDPVEVLVTGGRPSTAGNPIAAFERYDPVSGTFSADPNGSSVARAAHTMTLVANGEVVITGGFGTSSPIASVERYDGTSIQSATLTAARARHQATRVGTGNVLVTGGETATGDALFSAEVYDVTTDQLVPLANLVVNASSQMSAGRSFHTATFVGNGATVVAGGTNNANVTANLDVFFDGTQQGSTVVGFANTVTMAVARHRHTATFLSASNRLVFAGGLDSGGNAVATAETFDALQLLDLDPQGQTTHIARYDHGALPITLTNLAAGGVTSESVLILSGTSGASAVPSAQVLVRQNGDPCRVDDECLSGFCVGGACCSSVCDGPCQACSASEKASNADSGECGPALAQTQFSCIGNVELRTTCNGNDDVPATTTRICEPSTCDSAGERCATECQSDTDCAVDGWCDLDTPPMTGAGGGAAGGAAGTGGSGGSGGSLAAGGTGGIGGIGGSGGGTGGSTTSPLGTCRDRLSQGAKCDQPGSTRQCESDEPSTPEKNGVCVDGVCCSGPCTGTCEACDVEGSVGACSPIELKALPRGTAGGVPKACTGADPSNPCSLRCDGTERDSCAYTPNIDDVDLLDPDPMCSCNDDDCFISENRCDGAGAIGTQTMSCNGYQCDDETTCKTVCATDEDCFTDFICVEDACVPLEGDLCDGVQTLRKPGAPDEDCAPYACREGATECANPCGSVDDCAQGFVCIDGACEAPLEPAEVPACSCRIVGAPTPPAPPAPAALALLGLAVAVRRRRQT